MKRLLFVFALLGFASTCHAQFVTGNKLYTKCVAMKQWEATNQMSASEVQIADGMFCMGYVAGVADAADGPLVDIPAGATQQQLADIVYDYLDKHPESRNLSAMILVRAALTNTFGFSAEFRKGAKQ